MNTDTATTTRTVVCDWCDTTPATHIVDEGWGYKNRACAAHLAAWFVPIPRNVTITRITDEVDESPDSSAQYIGRPDGQEN